MPIGSFGEFVVNSTATNNNSSETRIAALPDGRIFMTWRSSETGFDVRGRVFNADGTATGNDFLVNETTAGNQFVSDVIALGDGRILTIYDSDPGISGRIFNADGSTDGAEFTVNTTANSAFAKATLLPDGRFVVAYESNDDIRGRIFNTDGSAAGDDFLLNSVVSNTQNLPDITALPDGGFVAAWSSIDGIDDTSRTGIRARLFDADGMAVGDDFLVNTTTDEIQANVSIASLADGGFVLTWDSTDRGDDADGRGIRARVYDSAGNADGDDFLVNTTTASNQFLSQVTGLADGRFVVVWSSFDSGTEAIRGRIFNADGTSSGEDDFLIGTQSAAQGSPSVRALDDGRFVVTWDFGTSDVEIRSEIFDPTIYKGTAGADVWHGGNLADRITGGADDDLLFGNAGDDAIHGDAGEDNLFGGDGEDQLFGGADGDTLQGGEGVDRLFAGAGDDTIYIGFEEDTAGEVYDGGGGIDFLRLTGEGSYDVDLRDDTVDEIDRITLEEPGSGGSGTARLRLNYDQMNGDGWYAAFLSGNDSATIADRFEITAGSVSTIDLSTTGLHSFTDFDDANDRISIIGDSDAETFTGTGFTDILVSGGGADTLEAGLGNDTYELGANTNAGLTVTDAGGTDTVTSTATRSLANAQLLEIEKLTLLGGGSINGTGNSLANTITGNNGRNTLDGGGRNDVLNGGLGVDRLIGNTGADTLTGGGSNDLFMLRTFRESTVAATGRDTIEDFSRAQRDKVHLSSIDADTRARGDQAFEFIGTRKFSKDAGELRFEKKGGDTFAHGDINGDGRADFSIKFDASITLIKGDFIL